MLYEKRPKPRMLIYTGWQMFLLDVLFVTFIMQRLGQPTQQTTQCNSFSTLLSYFEHYSQQNTSTFTILVRTTKLDSTSENPCSWIVSTVKRYTEP